MMPTLWKHLHHRGARKSRRLLLLVAPSVWLMSLLAAPEVAADPAASQSSIVLHRPGCKGAGVTLRGTNGPDVLLGTKGRDVIAGRGGDDIIRGKDGHDHICGGKGADFIDGGNDGDWLDGGQIVMLGDLNPGTESSARWELRAAHNRVFFVARDPVHGREPWVSDGTSQGTVLIGDIEPGPAGSVPSSFTPTDHGVVFITNTIESDPDSPLTGYMWSTTATGTGGDVGTTTLLTSGPTLGPMDGAPLGGNALLLTSDFQENSQVWLSNGTQAGTTLVKEHLILGSDLQPVGDFAFFLDAQNPLMRTDGTPEGTRQVRSWPDGRHGSTVVQSLTVVGQRVFFWVNSVKGIGTELWVSNGTRSGTRLVKDIRPGPTSPKLSWLAPRGRMLFFVANDGRHGGQLWRSDGTSAGTTRVTGLPDSHIGHVTGCRGSVYFTAEDRRGNELWSSSGRPGQAHRVADLAPGPRDSGASQLTCIKGGLAFSANDGRNGRELWTVAGPRATPVLREISPTGSAAPSWLIRVGPTLYFTADDGRHGREPWALRR